MVRGSVRRSPASFLSFAVAVSMLLPSLAAAASRSITDVVNTSTETVSRYDFLSWSTELLDIPTTSSACTLDYPRVPKASRGVLCAAQKKGALTVFGDDLLLARPILRGEALIVLTALTGRTSPNTDVSAYRDASSSSPQMKRAVQNAIGHRWMNPLTDATFGTTRRLVPSEALSVLSAVTGRQPAKTNTETIRIRFETPTKTNVPSTTGTSGISSDIPQSDLLRTVWQLIQRDYLRTGDIDDTELGYATIEGLVKGLNDPYTTFFRPVQASNFQTQIKGELTGIGAHVEERDGYVVIVAPLPGTPAEKAGLKTGDIILRAGNHDLSGLGIEEAIEFIRGPKGSTVELKIRRNGDEFTVSLVRDTISIPEIEISWKDNVAIVKVVQFGETTNTQFRDLMSEIASQNPRGIVLDLRNNPGGLLNAADVVVSNFIPQGSVVAQVKGRESSTNEITQNAPTIPAEVKLVVLVNEGSASASEIVAGALQDHKRATIVGAKTFGKGTVQELLTFKSGEAIKITIAEWLTPFGRKIDKVGVIPDIIVDNADQQLQRAINEAK